jgi:uracil-DNA glycosylase family 4
LKFDELKKSILKCRECEEKFGFKPNPVVHGKAKTKIFQISQAPSKNVHMTGKPFTDASGKKLVEQWYGISYDKFYNEDNFYITALAHCFPGKTKSGGDRLPPSVCTKKGLIKEMDVVEKELYIVIGSRAAKFLFPNVDFKELVMNTYKLGDIDVIVLTHPSPLNIKWFKDNPEFYDYRLEEIRQRVKATII